MAAQNSGLINAGLRRLDKQDWWRWASVAVVTLLLTFGVFTLSLPTLRRDFLDQRELDIGVSGLFGVVLLFDVFAFHQQYVISRLRGELTKQVAMAATLELLKPPDPEALAGRKRMRRFARFHFDQRISVVTVASGKPVIIYGRTSDLSEGGAGAVIPESLPVGKEITVEVTLDGSTKLLVPAVVRTCRGFHHGIEFLQITPAQKEQIRRACAQAIPVAEPGDYAPSAR